jgi:hypothetical protein
LFVSVSEASYMLRLRGRPFILIDPTPSEVSRYFESVTCNSTTGLLASASLKILDLSAVRSLVVLAFQ